MADDAAGSDGPEDTDSAPDGDERRRTSVSGPDARGSADETADRGERRPRDDRPATDRDADDADEPYSIPLDLTGDRDGTAESAAGDADEDDQYGPEPSSTPVEPGDPDLENVIFVFLGAIAMALVLFRVATLPL